MGDEIRAWFHSGSAGSTVGKVLGGVSPETGVEGSNGAGQIKARSGGHGKEDVNPCLVHLPGL